jgi:hypothetical protein
MENTELKIRDCRSLTSVVLAKNIHIGRDGSVIIIYGGIEHREVNCCR